MDPAEKKRQRSRNDYAVKRAAKEEADAVKREAARERARARAKQAAPKPETRFETVEIRPYRKRCRILPLRTPGGPVQVPDEDKEPEVRVVEIATAFGVGLAVACEDCPYVGPLDDSEDAAWRGSAKLCEEVNRGRLCSLDAGCLVGKKCLGWYRGTACGPSSAGAYVLYSEPDNLAINGSGRANVARRINHPTEDRKANAEFRQPFRKYGQLYCSQVISEWNLHFHEEIRAFYNQGPVELQHDFEAEAENRPERIFKPALERVRIRRTIGGVEKWYVEYAHSNTKEWVRREEVDPEDLRLLDEFDGYMGFQL